MPVELPALHGNEVEFRNNPGRDHNNRSVQVMYRGVQCSLLVWPGDHGRDVVDTGCVDTIMCPAKEAATGGETIMVESSLQRDCQHEGVYGRGDFRPL